MNRLLRLPLISSSSVITLAAAEASGATTSELYDLVADRLRRAYGLVCEQHALMAARVENPISALSLALQAISI